MLKVTLRDDPQTGKVFRTLDNLRLVNAFDAECEGCCFIMAMSDNKPEPDAWCRIHGFIAGVSDRDDQG
jgi:hypothetical protein